MNKKMWLLVIVGVALIIQFFIPAVNGTLIAKFGNAEQYALARR